MVRPRRSVAAWSLDDCVLPEPVWPGSRAPSAPASATPAISANTTTTRDDHEAPTTRRRRRRIGARVHAVAQCPDRRRGTRRVVVVELLVGLVVDPTTVVLGLEVVERLQEEVTFLLEFFAIVDHASTPRSRSTNPSSAAVARRRGSRRARASANQMPTPPSASTRTGSTHTMSPRPELCGDKQDRLVVLVDVALQNLGVALAVGDATRDVSADRLRRGRVAVGHRQAFALGASQLGCELVRTRRVALASTRPQEDGHHSHEDHREREPRPVATNHCCPRAAPSIVSRFAFVTSASW